MQFHQGLRLKNLIEKSHLKVKTISENSGIALSTLYDLYKKPEILRSKIEPILKAMEIDPDVFYQSKPGNTVADPQAAYGLQAQVEALQREVELLKKQIEAKDEIINLLKTKHTKK